ncbi:hypothetical protein NDN16_12345 [Aureimonas altamirensis]|uniref:hypothetical protein n=1 Tax=Aureimonas altamirensis TaxID=370622 RepID=UPI002036AEFC|nr:hypothetical protein [Aureimonas altamirensis]MCM2504462.1 hypothetical protein [Aureimonas altamirensis]
MPWKQYSVMDERVRFVGRLLDDEGMSDVCRAFGIVSFMNYDLGYIDLEQKTLQTIDNPFGTRLSPMS